MNTQIAKIKVDIEYQGENDWEGFISRAEEIRILYDDIRFQLGDLAHQVTTKFGTRGFKLFSKEIGVKVSTLRRYRDVSKAFEPELREEFAKLSWSVFRLIAPHQQNKRKLLLMAHDESLSVEKLGMYLDGKIENVQKTKTAKPEMGYCDICDKWYITIDELSCRQKGTHD